MASLTPFLSLALFLSVRFEVISANQSLPLNTTFKAHTSIDQFPITATISNASTSLFTNTTSSNSANFSYIIPYGQSQECDIYGLICQTGSITVGVNLTTTTTSTVLPCSSYLTAQSSYLDSVYGTTFEMPVDWAINFGHSPECRSYAADFQNGKYTRSGCGGRETVIPATNWGTAPDGIPYPAEFPPGAQQSYSHVYVGSCCGNCSLDVKEVRLYYFPDNTAVNYQNNQTLNSSSTILGKRVQSLVADGSTAVVSGHTFTSPSVYLQVVGTAAVHDLCTTIDPILTNPVMAFSPGELSTWKPPSASEGGDSFAVGSTYFDPNAGNFDDNIGTFAPLAVKDLANPTWGLGISGTSDDGNVITTIGPPWLPLISPPMEAFSLDPAWELLCTGLLTDPMNINSLALFDPPIALTRGPGLVPAPVIPVAAPTPLPAPNHADTTTVLDKQAAPSTAAAEPANSPTDPADPPARTGDPGRDGASPSVAMADPAKPGSPPSDPAATPTNKSYPPSTSEAPAGGPEDPSNSQDDPSAESKVFKPDATRTAPADLKRPSQPAPQQSDGSQPLTQGLGAIIYNAFGKAGPQISEVTDEVKTITLPIAGVQKVSIGGGQVLSIDPSGLMLEGKTYFVGGPAVTLSNNVYTVVPSNEDDSLIKRPSPFPDTLVIAGQTVTPNPTEMIIAGSSVLPGGSAVTISNTPVSLDPSRILVVGSSSFSMPAQSIFTVGTQSFTANPTSFTLNGATISPGAAAQTVDGTVLSLGYSGALAIGTSTYSLPTPLSNDPAISPFTIAGQTFTPNPSAFSIAGTTILAGGAPITLAGTIISLGQSGALVIGSSTVLLPTPTSTLLAVTPVTLAGQTFTPNPSAFSIAGTTISAGGPAVTIAGTVISLRPSGTLIVGSSTISLLAPQTNSPTLLDIDGLSVQVQSSFAIVDGMTISPGAPGILVDGKNVSLEAGGATLDVGTGRFALPTESVNKSAGVLAFEGGQGKGVEVSLMVLLSFGIGGSLILMV